jgi:peroxiredoxin
VRPFGISLDSPWSHRAWAESLGITDTVPLLSDRLGEAAEGFGVLGESDGMPKALRSAFLVDGDAVRASWALSSDLDEIHAVIAVVTG